MYHLKKKVKNKAHIGGSIIAQYVNEEISTASANFFGNPHVVPEVPLPGKFGLHINIQMCLTYFITKVGLVENLKRNG